jgi:tripartite-type tricarboxylate transporter receptor subunit TctC
MYRKFAFLVLAALIGTVQAQDQAGRAVKILVPYSPGGPSDSMARLTARYLGEKLGQSYVTENRPGASGAIAGQEVARSTPDGHTLLWVTPTQVSILPALSKLSYDPVADFVPVTAVASNRFVLVVNRERMPVSSLGEFVQYVRARPGKLAYADAGQGSLAHLAMALFLTRLGLEMTSVSYKGLAPALTDVAAGHVPAMFASLADAVQHRQRGSIALLAVSSDTRAPQAADVPTLIEGGLAGFKVVSWNGLMAPAGTPKGIVDRIAAAVSTAVKDPDFASRLTGQGFDPLGSTPQQFAAVIAADTAIWTEAARSAGLSGP